MRIVSALITIFILSATTIARSQNTIGIPDIVSYTKEAYNAGTQNRALAQDRNGVLYFANYEGLLSFDGTWWTLYPLPNRSVVRSLAIGADSRIYVGGQDEFGYFSPDKHGKLQFTSLKSGIPPQYLSFSDVWNIVPHGNDIFFRSSERIFRLSNHLITVYPAATAWQFLGISNGELIAQDEKNGLLHFKDGVWAPFIRQSGVRPGAVGRSALPPGSLVTAIFPLGPDSSFLTTVNTGFFILYRDEITPFHWPGSNPFANDRILTAIPVNRDWIAIGTNLDGCFIIDKQGRIIQDLSRKEGLQNNNILGLFVDKDDNLWLGLDNGIDFIAYNNAIKHVYPEKLNEGLGYTSIIYDHTLYVGTSNGLYQVPLSEKEDKKNHIKEDLSLVNGEFKSVPGTKGSTWGLTEMNGLLLLGHHDGAFQIGKSQPASTVMDVPGPIPSPLSLPIPLPISRRTDYWTFLPLSRVLPADWVIAGNDEGIDLLHFEHDAFVPKGNLPGFDVSSQFIAIDDNARIWVAHPFRGIFRISNPLASYHTITGSPTITGPATITDSPIIKHYTEKDGLPSTLKNHLFRIRNRIVAATENGVYEYNTKTDRFEQSAFFKPFFGQKNIRHLKEDAAGNIWFIENKDLGVIDFSGARPEVIYFPELSSKMVSDFEHIYPYDPSNVFVGAEKGFYHINYRQYRHNHYTLQVRIRSVKAAGKTDSLLWGGYYGEVNEHATQPADAIPRISHSWNSLHFEFSAPVYATLNSVEYSYRLRGFDKDWSAWSKKAEKDYTNLPAGRYSFEVRAKSDLGNESPVSTYSFTLLPPVWLSTPAWFVYTILLFGLVWFLYKRQVRQLLQQQRKHEEEQKRLQYLHDLELEKSEKEIVKLNNEKLEAEIGHKNRELASSAMHLVQKGELLANIREELMRLKKNNDSIAEGSISIGTGSADDLKKILRILNEEDKTDKDWEQFVLHFDQVHSHFLRNLRLRYPTLSPHELKLCAYLRMNLSSKQIARLESITVRGVEIGRYRLRKKLKIPTETNLFDFLLDIDGSPIDGSSRES